MKNLKILIFIYSANLLSNEIAPCRNPRLKEKYNNGIERGVDLANNVWERFGRNCDREEEFLNRIMERLENIRLRREGRMEERPGARCNFAGLMEGVQQRLDNIQINCGRRCFKNGKFIGRMAAKTYCDLVLEAQGDINPEEWMRGPINACGLNFQISCDSIFIGKTREYQNDLGACRPFTEGSFNEKWNRSRSKSCDFNNRIEDFYYNKSSSNNEEDY